MNELKDVSEARVSEMVDDADESFWDSVSSSSLKKSSCLWSFNALTMPTAECPSASRSSG